MGVTRHPLKDKEVKSLSRVGLFATPWTVDYHAPLSMGFSRQETGVGCYVLLQRIFLTQESNLGLPHCRQTLYRLTHQEVLEGHLDYFPVCLVQIKLLCHSEFSGGPERH